MAKELPYFKFYCSEWNDGDITLEDYHHQGVFINVCSYYWSNECNVSKQKLYKRFRGLEDEVDYLESLNLIKIKSENVIINFLNEQWKERGNKSKINSINGAKGGRPKKQTESENKPNAFNSLSETKGNKKREEKKREEKSIYYFASDYLENNELVKAIQTNFKISPDEFTKWFDKFKLNYIEPQNELEFSNAKKHFVNWLKKQPIKIQETLEERIERKRKDADKFS